MKNSEQTIEKVLSGLKSVEAPPNMERRILTALEARTHHPAQTHQHRPAPGGFTKFTRAFALPAACGLAAMLTLALLIPSMRRKQVAMQPAQTVSSLQLAPARIGPEQASPQANAPITHQQAAGKCALCVFRWERRASALRNSQQIQGALAPGPSAKADGRTFSAAHQAITHPPQKPVTRDTYEDLAEGEMRAPSRPAPPMPLTDQEKLLLRLVHANDPVELASLDSETWATQFARSKAQFDKFFALPKTAPTGDQQ